METERNSNIASDNATHEQFILESNPKSGADAIDHHLSDALNQDGHEEGPADRDFNRVASHKDGSSTENPSDEASSEGDSDWEEHLPPRVVSVLKRSAIDPKYPERGGVDLNAIVVHARNDGKIRSFAASEVEVHAEQIGPLGDLLAPDVTVLIADRHVGGSRLALAIAEAVATGRDVLGIKTKAVPVLFVDPVRPRSAIRADLSLDSSELSNLLLMGSDTKDGVQDAYITHEIENLSHEGIMVGLVVINEIGRFSEKLTVQSFAIKGTSIPVLLVAAEAKYKPNTPFRSRVFKPGVVDLLATKKVLTLSPYADEYVRLSMFEYGELKRELAVDPKNWEALGIPEAGVSGKRQAKVLQEVSNAGHEGIEPKDVASALGMSAANAYQALLLLKRDGKIFKQGKLYYLAGVMLQPAPAPTARSS